MRQKGDICDKRQRAMSEWKKRRLRRRSYRDKADKSKVCQIRSSKQLMSDRTVCIRAQV